MIRNLRRLLGALLLGVLPLLQGCVLTDVTTVPGEDVLVVESVLRVGAERQILLLHRSVQDQIVRGESGATVIVRTAEGREIRFTERRPGGYPEETICGAPFSPPEQAASCYVSPRSAGEWVEGGETYELEIRTRGGEQLRGRTQVPNPFYWSFVSRPLDGQIPFCEIPPGEPWEIAWAPSEGAWSYVADLEIFGLRERLAEAGVLPPDEIPDPLKLFGLAISENDTTLVVPTNFGLFERFDFDQRLLQALQQGFPEGTVALLTLAAADRNYVNGIRGGNFNPSGPVRIGSVVGDGVGTFGSLYPIWLVINVRPGPISCSALPPDGLKASALLRSGRRE